MLARRSKIAPQWLVYLLAVVVLATLYSAYPRGKLQNRLLSSEAPTDVSVAYLEAWLRVEPDNAAVLSILGEQYGRLNRYADARRMAALMESMHTEAMHREALLLTLTVDMRDAFARPETDPKRAEMIEHLSTQLADAATLPWSTDDLKTLAETSASINMQRLAMRFYARLSEQDAAHRPQWDAQVIRFAMYAGDYRAAADAWFRLQALATSLDEQRRCFIAGIRALQSGNMLDAALAAADEHGKALQNDRATLLVLLNLARATHSTDRVNRYAKALAGYAQVTPAPLDASIRMAALHVTPSSPPSLSVRLTRRVKYLKSPLWNPATFTYMDGGVAVAQPQRGAARTAGYDSHDAGAGHILLVESSADDQTPDMPSVAPATPLAPTPWTGAIPAKKATANTMPVMSAAQGVISAKRSAALDELAVGDVSGLIYQSFLESGDLANAQRFASEQVVKDPRSAVWAKRLAQVAEWNSAAPLALAMWQRYSEISGDPNGWKNVLRLAPMLNDDNAFLSASVESSNREPGDLKRVDTVIATFERLGRPDDGLAFLKAHDKGAEAEQIELRIGTLAERAGHEDEALKYYRQLHKAHPDNTLYALRTAAVLFRHDDFNGALDALLASRANAATDDTMYWRNLSQLARLQQRDDIANDAYRHLLASGVETPEDLAAMTYFYNTYPIDAARTAEAQYRRSHDFTALREAIHYYTDADAADRATVLLQGMSPEELATAENDSEFLRVRAEYARRVDRPADVLRDLRRAVQLPGATLEMRAALLWALVDYGSDEEVRAGAAPWQDSTNTPSMMWGPLAASYMRLNQPEAALRYLRLQAGSMSRDPLWLLVYAEAQDMAGRDDLAWTIRRDVWRQMKQDEAAVQAHGEEGEKVLRDREAQDSDAREQTRGRRITLASIYENADVSKALLNDLLSSDANRTIHPAVRRTLLGDTAGLPPMDLPAPAMAAGDVGAAGASGATTPPSGALISSVAKDVALAWALSHEGDARAKRWLATQYASSLTRPAEQQMAIALAEDDKATMARLLDQKDAKLSLYNRIDASIAVDRRGAAEQMAFDGLAAAPDSNPLHGRLLDSAMNWPQSLSTGVTSQTVHPLNDVEHTVAGSIKIGDHYMLGVDGTQRFQSSADPTQLVNVPSVDRSVNFTLQRQTDNTAFSVTAGRREALDSFYTLSLGAEFNRNGPLSLSLRAGRNQVSPESQTLLVGGVKDNVIASATWNPTPHLYATGTVEADRFYSQDRTYLGGGTQTTEEVGYRVRTDYPDYTVRVVGVQGNYHASGQPAGLISRLIPADDGTTTGAAVMPKTFQQYGVFVGFGNQLRDRNQYTRAWRPFVDVGIAHDSLQGWGPQVSAGLAGSVFGGDHMVLFYSRQQVSGVGAAVTLMGVQYIWFY